VESGIRLICRGARKNAALPPKRDTSASAVVGLAEE